MNIGIQKKKKDWKKPRVKEKIGDFFFFFFKSKVPTLNTYFEHDKLRIVGSQGQLSVRKWLHMLPVASWMIWIKQKQL